MFFTQIPDMHTEALLRHTMTSHTLSSSTNKLFQMHFIRSVWSCFEAMKCKECVYAFSSNSKKWTKACMCCGLGLKLLNWHICLKHMPYVNINEEITIWTIKYPFIGIALSQHILYFVQLYWGMTWKPWLEK